MYAIVISGGKQYKVSKGNSIEVERISGNVGELIEFKEVLMVSNNDKIDIGTPYLDNVKVIGEIIEQKKGKKIIVFKFKRRKGYRKKIGHRQLLTKLKIKDITL
jgi:large subunit ribosomal protein L21